MSSPGGARAPTTAGEKGHGFNPMNDNAHTYDDTRWSDRSLTELIEHILATHHAYTRAKR